MNDLKGIIEDCNKSDLISDKVIKKIIEIIGQEEWQELHDENNDVCTTMGELIITLKGIAELEKENAELKAQIEKMRSALIEVMCQSVNTTSEIYKKNTEQIEKMKCCENCKHHCFWGDELKCMVLSYEEELKCMKTKGHWEIQENDRQTARMGETVL